MRRWNIVQDKFNGKIDVEPEDWIFLDYGRVLERTMESASELLSMIDTMSDGQTEANAAVARDLNRLKMANNVDLSEMTPDKVNLNFCFENSLRFCTKNKLTL